MCSFSLFRGGGGDASQTFSHGSRDRTCPLCSSFYALSGLLSDFLAFPGLSFPCTLAPPGWLLKTRWGSEPRMCRPPPAPPDSAAGLKFGAFAEGGHLHVGEGFTDRPGGPSSYREGRGHQGGLNQGPNLGLCTHLPRPAWSESWSPSTKL